VARPVACPAGHPESGIHRRAAAPLYYIPLRQARLVQLSGSVPSSQHKKAARPDHIGTRSHLNSLLFVYYYSVRRLRSQPTRPAPRLPGRIAPSAGIAQPPRSSLDCHAAVCAHSTDWTRRSCTNSIKTNAANHLFRRRQMRFTHSAVCGASAHRDQAAQASQVPESRQCDLSQPGPRCSDPPRPDRSL